MGLSGRAPDPHHTRKGGRRGLLFGLLALGVLAVVAAVAFLPRLASSSPSPAEVLPNATSGVVEFNLAPEIGQARELQHFVEGQTELMELVDARSWAHGGAGRSETPSAGCTAREVVASTRPWIGERAAVAIIPGQARPVWVVQVRDAQAAASGIQSLVRCGIVPAGSADFDGGVVLASSDDAAQQVLEEGRSGSLSGLDSYVEDSKRVSAPGLLTFWGERSAVESMLARPLGSLLERGPGHQLSDELRAQDWRSAAGMVRINQGAPEFKVAIKSNRPHAASTSNTGISSLPGDTALAVGISDGDEIVQEHPQAVERLVDELMPGRQQAPENRRLRIPDDLVSVLGSDAKVGWAVAPSTGAGTTLSPRILIGGRNGQWPGRAREEVQRLDPAGSLKPAQRRRTVAFAPDEASASAALRPTSELQDDAAFKRAYPKPEQAQMGFYANLKSLGPVAMDAVPQELRPWAEQLEAVGANAHNEDANYSVVRVAAAPLG